DRQLVLGEQKDVVPETCFEMRLELGEIEVQARARLALTPAAVKQVEAEVEQARRDRLAIDPQVRLVEMPAARPHEQGRDLGLQRVLLLAGVQRDGAVDRVDQVRLSLDAVPPGRRVRI